jgi:hypothetical protein
VRARRRPVHDHARRVTAILHPTLGGKVAPEALSQTDGRDGVVCTLVEVVQVMQHRNEAAVHTGVAADGRRAGRHAVPVVVESLDGRLVVNASHD